MRTQMARLVVGAGTIMLLTVAGAEGQSGGARNPFRAHGISANNVFFYYADLDAATAFYTATLGLALVADYGMAKILHVAPTSFLTLVDEEAGMHRADEPKTVALALVTDQLDAWHRHLVTEGVQLRSAFQPTPGRPHDGFVAIDPEGYYLEFERFNEHPENVQLMPALEASDSLRVGGRPPDGLGFKATIVWLYYRDLPGIQRFYEQSMGLSLIVDQGWAKIYRTSRSGYIGLVDESRGMHRYTEAKAVTVSLLTGDLDGWFGYARSQDAFEMRSLAISEGNPRYRAFVAYDPEGYYLEFDTFLEHPDNVQLLEALGQR